MIMMIDRCDVLLFLTCRAIRVSAPSADVLLVDRHRRRAAVLLQEEHIFTFSYFTTALLHFHKTIALKSGACPPNFRRLRTSAARRPKSAENTPVLWTIRSIINSCLEVSISIKMCTLTSQPWNGI